MKIIHFILIVFFLSAYSSLSGQDYYKLLKDDRHWIYSQMASGEDPPVHIVLAFALSVQGDTQVLGNTYKKIYQQTLKLNVNSTAIHNPKVVLDKYLYALMREDTVTRKVYMIPFRDTISMCQSSEHLLYDFSLMIGDTLNDCVLENLYEPWLDYIPRIDTIWEGNYFGLETRFFYTDGIFINYGDIFDGSGFLLEGFGYEQHGLINYGRKGPLVLFNYFCEGDSLDCELLSGISELPLIPPSLITFFPNPAKDFVNLHIDPDFQNGSKLDVFLFNLMGNNVYYENWNTLKELTIDISKLQNGIYFLNVNGDKFRTVKKIVIAH